MDLIKKTRDENWEEEDWCKDRWMLQGYVVNSGSHISATANVSLCYNGDGMETVAFGIGPIEAAFHAIENIVQTGAQLVSYSIRSMSQGMDAQGQVEVQLEHGGNTITGVGPTSSKPASRPIWTASIRFWQSNQSGRQASRFFVGPVPCAQSQMGVQWEKTASESRGNRGRTQWKKGEKRNRFPPGGP